MVMILACHARDTSSILVGTAIIKETFLYSFKCVECLKNFETKDKRQKFCSRNCSATFYNRSRWKGYKRKPKKKRVSKTPCSCGGVKYDTSELCQKCRTHKQCLDWLDKELKSIIDYKRSGPHRYNRIRAHARKMMKLFGGEYKCIYCDFNLCLHVDHIRQIKDFEEDVLIKEVNGLHNLRYVCPNHHALITKGLL